MKREEIGEREELLAWVDSTFGDFTADKPHQVVEQVKEIMWQVHQRATAASAARIAELEAQVSALKAQKLATEISADLREYAGNPGYSHGDYADTMRKAADEIERYYGGMMNWKRAAEAKDAQFSALKAAGGVPQENPHYATFPEEIWLQVGDCDASECAPFSELSEITWCQDCIDSMDVRYVRADLAAPQAAEQTKQQEPK